MAHDIASNEQDARIWVNLLFEGADAQRLARQRDRRHLKASTTFVRQLVMERIEQLEAEQAQAPAPQSSEIANV